MGQYTEGQRLHGSDGNIYVVRNGVPMREVAPMQAPKAQYEPAQAAANLQRTQQEIQQANATAASTAAKAKAEAQSAAIKAQTDQEAYNAAHPKGTGATVYGPDYLKTLSAPDQELIKALADGRLAFPTGNAVKSPWWQQKLEQVAQFDPSFDATNYNTRAKARAALVNGKLGASSNAINTAIGHVGHLGEQISGTSSLGGFPFATDVNKVVNAYNQHYGKSGITNFQDTAQKLADELESAYRNGGGAEQGVVRQLRSLDANASDEQKHGIVANALELLASKQAANLYQYNLGSGGKPPVDLLDPSARAVLDQFPDVRDKYFGAPTQPISHGAAALITAHGGTPPAPPSGGLPPPSGGNPVIGGPGLAPADASEKSLPIPQAYQDAHAAYLAKNWGHIDPNDYASFRAKEDAKYGFAPSLDAYRAIVPDLNARAQQGGSPSGLNIPPVNAKTNGLDRFNATVFNNPVGAAVLGAGSLGGGADEVVAALKTPFTGRSYQEELDRANAIRQAASSQYPKASFAGNLAGTAALATATGGAGLFADSPILVGSIYGGTSGALENNDNRFGGAVGGAALGTGGGALGKYAFAPVAKAAMDTQAGQLASRGGRKLYNGMFGNRTGLSVADAPVVPSFAPGESALPGSGTLGTARTNLQGAADLGLPYSLADADPKLRMLAGSVARKSPTARDLAETTFDPRARGQADRAVSAIDTHLAPITNIEQRGSDLLAAGDQAAGPSYNMAFQRPGPVDPEIAAMLDTPAGKASLAHARTIAANRGIDPNKAGFDLNDQGDVVLKSVPSFDTLQLVKRGMDAHLNSFADNFGNLNLRGNPLAQSVADLKTRFNGKLGELNPQYAEGNKIWSGFAQRKDALDQGYNVLPNNAVPKRQFDASFAGLNDQTLPEAQMGYATNMADTVNKARLSANPYDTVFGSPLQQQKVGAMFPDGADKFGKIYDFERDMAKTRNETIGGSPTAPRLAADQMFDSPGGQAIDAAVQLKTGGGVSLAQVAKLGSKLASNYRLGLGAKKADALAPTLFNTDPASALDYIDNLSVRKAQDEMRKQAFARNYGMFGALALPNAAIPSGGY